MFLLLGTTGGESHLSEYPAREYRHPDRIQARLATHTATGQSDGALVKNGA
jgi:hypothetical protein